MCEAQNIINIAQHDLLINAQTTGNSQPEPHHFLLHSIVVGISGVVKAVQYEYIFPRTPYAAHFFRIMLVSISVSRHVINEKDVSVRRLPCWRCMSNLGLRHLVFAVRGLN